MYIHFELQKRVTV